MIEIIDNHTLPNIPTLVHEEGSTVFENYDMSSSIKVNESLIGVFAQIAGEGWSNGEPQKANFTFQIDLPIVGQIGAFSLIILWFEHKAFQIYNPSKDPPDEDPSGNIVAGVGPDGSDATVIGVPVNSNMGQNEIIMALANEMAKVQSNYTYIGIEPIDDPDSPLYGVFTKIEIKARLGGAEWNDLSGIGNIVGGGVFNGLAKFGGYELNSPPSGDVRLRLTIWNNPTSNFTFRAHFLRGPRGNPESLLTTSALQERVMHKRRNYTVFAGPRQWGIFPKVYEAYSPTSIIDVLQGVDDYHFCGPWVPPDQANPKVVGADKATLYCGFAMATRRDKLNEFSDCATCINDNFRDGFFQGLDTGVVYLAYNSMYHGGGPLRTTAGKSLKYSAVICLSPGNSFFNRSHDPPLPWASTPANVYAYVPDMYMTTEAVPLNTKVQDPVTRRTFIAYRVQVSPCECTLWLGVVG